MVIVGTFSPLDEIKTDTMPEIPIATNIEPRMTFDLGAAVEECEPVCFV